MSKLCYHPVNSEFCWAAWWLHAFWFFWNFSLEEESDTTNPMLKAELKTGFYYVRKSYKDKNYIWTVQRNKRWVWAAWVTVKHLSSSPSKNLTALGVWLAKNAILFSFTFSSLIIPQTLVHTSFTEFLFLDKESYTIRQRKSLG